MFRVMVRDPVREDDSVTIVLELLVVRGVRITTTDIIGRHCVTGSGINQCLGCCHVLVILLY